MSRPGTTVPARQKCVKNFTSGGNPKCSEKKIVENELKFCDVKLLLLKIDEAYCINK